MSLSAKLRLGTVLLLCASLAAAQSNLGTLLDAGAKKLSPEEFKEELVLRTIVGPTATGGSLEVMYANSGVIQGIGNYGAVPIAPISGEWKVDDGRICTSMRIGVSPGGAASGLVMLPPRCQFWFKYNEAYFLSDSDSDRSAKVLRRTVKQ
jgi:hypothetical protein